MSVLAELETLIPKEFCDMEHRIDPDNSEWTILHVYMKVTVDRLWESHHQAFDGKVTSQMTGR